ncbi:MAG TPA: hypothetical protein VH596_06675 [Terriglobales bacterium]|jgi:hypothetical protein
MLPRLCLLSIVVALVEYVPRFIELCLGHTMPPAEYPFKQFWTKDPGSISLPGYLAAGVGITSCQ